MNTYLFIQTTRKGPPLLEFLVQSNSPEDAIEQVNYYPYDIDEDFRDEYGNVAKTRQERVNEVMGYYGLIKDHPCHRWNGDEGYGTLLIEVSDKGTKARAIGNTAPDQKSSVTTG